MDEIYENPEMTILITNKDNNNKICDFEVEFQKTIQLRQPSVVGVQEICIPTNLKTSKFSQIRQYKLKFFWTPNILEGFKQVVENDIIKNYDINIIHEHIYSIPPGIYSVEDLIKLISDKSQEYDKLIKMWWQERIPTLSVNDETKFDYQLPSLTLDSTEKVFKNETGHIGIKDNETHLPIVYLFFNFDFELHQILGFDPNIFPNVVTVDHRPTQAYNGLAKYKPNFELFDIIYLYSNIVKETYLGSKKVNILKVFARQNASVTQDKDTINYSFENIFFVPVRLEEINSIRVIICDSFGSVASYNRGEISVTLLIRTI